MKRDAKTPKSMFGTLNVERIDLDLSDLRDKKDRLNEWESRENSAREKKKK